MKQYAVLGALAIALLGAAAPVQADAASDYDWAYLFAGQAQVLEVDVGPNALLFTLRDITVSGDLAADARAAIDNLQGVGDGDGTITENEVVNFETIAQTTVNSMLPNEFDFTLVTIDGKQAASSDPASIPKVQVTALDIQGAEGDVASTAAITTDIGIKLRFDTVDKTKSSHAVRFENVYGDFDGMDSTEVPPAQVVISGYRSWAIDGESVQPAAFADRLSEDELVLTNADIAHFDQEGEGLAFTIEGDPSVSVGEHKRGSPGVGAVGLVAALGVLVAMLRRRQ